MSAKVMKMACIFPHPRYDTYERPQLCSLAMGSQSRGFLYFFIMSVSRMSSSLDHPYAPALLVAVYGLDKISCCDWLGPALGTRLGGARKSGGGWKPPPPRCPWCDGGEARPPPESSE